MEVIEQIRRYISNQLSDSERSDFEREMENDPELMKIVEQERLMMKGIVLSERSRLKSALQETNSNHKKYWYTAAALIPLLLVSYFFLYDSSGFESIYTDYYEPYGVYEFGEVRGPEANDQKEREAFESYEMGKYQEALKKINQLQKENDQVGYNLYAGVCLLELGRYDEAIDRFDQIPNTSDYFEIGKWYQALVFIKKNQIDHAKKLLHSISKNESGLGRRAQELLDRL